MTSFPLRREKALPDIPVYIDNSEPTAEHTKTSFIPSLNTNKALPSVRAEYTLSEGEMSRLHELWNEAGLTSRAHRRRHRDHNRTPRRNPTSIPKPEPEDIPSVSTSAAPSIKDRTPPDTATRRRRIFHGARQETKKWRNALVVLRAIAQAGLRKRLRRTKSVPNLSGSPGPSKRVTLQLTVGTIPIDASVNCPCTLPTPGKSATPEVFIQSEDADKNAIYFTVDPTWRVSQSSVRFQFITPIPDGPPTQGRPDSPLLHRHFSLDQLSFAAQESRVALTAMEIPAIYPGNEALHPIDELHAYLDL